MLSKFKLYSLLVLMQLKSQIIYNKSFAVEIVAHLIQMATHIGGIFFIFYYVKSFSGWSLWEVLYLYGVTSLAFVVAQIIGEAFEDIGFFIKSGQFDQMLTRPASPLIQIAALSFRIERFGGIVQSIAALVIVAIQTTIFSEFYNIFLTAISIASMISVYYALFIANGAFTFWALESNEIFNAFTYGGVEVAKYPISIYDKWMQNIFIYIIPLGFMNYFPAIEIFNKKLDTTIPTYPAVLAPCVAILFCIIILKLWHFSLKHYQSTGS